MITASDAEPARLEEELARLRAAWAPAPAELWECTGRLDLRPCGFDLAVRNPWYLRPPGPLPDTPQRTPLVVERARTPRQLAAFEVANLAANEETELLAGPRLLVHPAATLADPAPESVPMYAAFGFAPAGQVAAWRSRPGA